MEIIETIISYVSDLLGGFDYAEVFSGIVEAVTYIISLITG